MTKPDQRHEARPEGATEQASQPRDVDGNGPRSDERRRFLIGLGHWSKAVVLGAVGGAALLADRPAQAGASWINRRGGVRGGGWVNRNGGGSWVNRRGGGVGGSWVNRR